MLNGVPFYVLISEGRAFVVQYGFLKTVFKHKVYLLIDVGNIVQ